MKNNNVGLKIITDTVSVELIKIVKKYRDGSIGEIKEDILNGNYVLSCAYSGDFERFNDIIKCYYEVSELGYSVELYEHNRKNSIDFFKNWSDSMADTRRQIEEDWDELLDTDTVTH